MQYSLKAGLLLAGMLSPLASQALSASRADLAAFLGTTEEAIEAINPRLGEEAVDVTRGSALRRTLNVNAGDTLSFDWLFGTDEGTLGANSGVVDYAFFSVNGLLTRLASVNDHLVPSDGATTFDEYHAPDIVGAVPAFQPMAITFANSGLVTIGFAVVDAADTIVSSGLMLDNFRSETLQIDNAGFEDDPLFNLWEVIGDADAWTERPGATEGNVAAMLFSGNGPSEVPLPAGVWLMGSALATLGWRRHRRG